ncbi:MAG: RNA 2',3'-cyclic phosphodiesterase [Thermoprotei archaeon]|nr:MAG: RNA 2',3'-cyclic phosphodiesterase [Thermoprotei archaeon]
MCGDNVELYRVFIAIEIENIDVLNKLIKVKDAFKATKADIKTIENENIHLTVRFIGEVPLDTVKAIQESLKNLKDIPVFNMYIRGIGAFPSLTRPRVIWAGITNGVTYLKEIRRRIEQYLRRLGIRPDTHEFTPHITLARVKGRRGIDKVIKLLEIYQDYEFGESPVTRVKLKRSILRPQGPLYLDLYEVLLKH